MNRAPIALCGLLSTLGSTLIAAGMAHDGSPCRFLPRPQPRIGVQATAPSRHPLASYDPTERWLDPAIWRQADLMPLERRHEPVVPTPVRRGDAVLKRAGIEPAISRAVSLPASKMAAPASKKGADVSLPRLVRAARQASQTEAALVWIAAQDGIEDASTGIYIRGTLKPLDQSVVDAFAEVERGGAITPWTVALHVGPPNAHVFDSNLGFDNRGVRVVRSVSLVEPKLWIDTQRQIARLYSHAAGVGIDQVATAQNRLVTVVAGLVDIAVAARGQVDRTATTIAARMPVKVPGWDLLQPTDGKPTEIGRKPAKLRSAKLPGGIKK